MPRGLLLDIGGVVLRGATVLAPLLAEEMPQLQGVLAETPIGTDRDELWSQMLRGEITEREYWSRRSAELGRAVGQTWGTRDFMDRLYNRPAEQWLVPETVALMRDAKAAGVRLGALTNDMRDFHGGDWVGAQSWLEPFDVIVDASDSGVYKPDPRAFANGAAALDLSPEEIVYLDDMPWNIEGGRAAGLLAVRVHYDDPGAATAEARRLLEIS